MNGYMLRATERTARPQPTCSNTSKCFITAVVVIRRSALYRRPSSCKTGSVLSRQRMRLHNPGPLEGEKQREGHTSVPGIGQLTATAITAFAGTGTQFKSGRHLASWLGLVPREFSTGGKQHLLGISKRGNPYLRKLLVHGARSCVLHLDRTKDHLGVWISAMEAKGIHRNKVIVALARQPQQQ
ncbi:transposase IS116/IS110/IS902 family protein [Paraburkholderia xenovorans LB400]|nr:transposase IS116/IS110/IS902 family protein [Paraburkholderia xenovorans LB400]